MYDFDDLLTYGVLRMDGAAQSVKPPFFAQKTLTKHGGLCYNKHTSNGVYFFVPVFRELPLKREAKIIP